jgi:hypothetical protein
VGSGNLLQFQKARYRQHFINVAIFPIEHYTHARFPHRWYG